MPPQKNSGNRGSKRDSPILKKNNIFFDAFISDCKKEGGVSDVYVGRIIRKLGNGRMDVFYMDGARACMAQALIRGLFRGKGKHSVDMDVNSVVLMSDSGIGGTAQFEIVCLVSREQIPELKRVFPLDPRITAFEVTDGSDLMKNIVADEGGFIITAEETEAEVDIDGI